MPGGLDYAAAELQLIARNLKRIADGGLLRELEKAITDAAKPVLDEVRAGVSGYVPSGYAAEFTASLRLTTSKALRGGSEATVQLRAAPQRGGPQRKVKKVNAGELSHPLFGDKAHWYRQTDGVKAGFFTDPAKRSAPLIRGHIVEAMDRVAAEAAR